MQPKFTLKKRGLFLFLSSFISAFFLLIAGGLMAQQYTNGNLSTGATHGGTSTAAPAGTTWSELQGTNTGLGFGANVTATLTLADDFIVPAGPSWNLTKITFFAYSTGFAGASSPFVDARVQIFNTDPSTGNPTPVFGDLTTNRIISSSFANMYRTGRTTADQTRKIWKIEVAVNTTLAPGTYWVEWALGNGGLSNFTPPSTVVGQPTPAGGNSKQRNYSTGLPGTWTAITDGGGGGAQDQHFIIDYATGGCSGTPAPGNTISSAASVCPGINFTLSLQTPTSGSGVSYQWQSSPDGTTWTNIGGATNSTYTSTLGATTQFRCNVTCGANTGTSTPTTVSLTPASGCYCIPPATDCTDDDVITRVRIGTLDNSSACSAGPPAGYTYYSSVAAPTIYSGAANPITINHAATYSKADAVWIDYNQNGQFETAEFTAIGTGAAGTAQISGTINIPTTALNGTTRMRVRMRFGTTQFTSAQACTNPSSFGETEDYNVTIAPCVPLTVTTSPANVSVTCGQNASFTVATAGTLPVYAWQFRTSASSNWQALSNGGIYSGATTATLTLTGVSAAYSGYQYRAQVVGGCSGVDFSQPATLTVNAIQPVVSPASATICLGSVQQLSLTNTVAEPTTVTFNATSGLPLTVPDGDPNGVLSSPIAVSGIPAGSVIKNVAVKFSMTHPWVGDIVMNLKAPNGQVLNLVGLLDGGNGTNGTDDFVNTVVDSLSTLAMSGAAAPRTNTFRADRFTVGAGAMGVAPTTTNFWAPLLGTMNGNWSVAFSDLGATDVGVLSAWSIAITYVAPNFAQGVWAGPAGTIFTNAAATAAYDGVTPLTTVYVKPTVTSNYTVNFTTSTPCTSATATVPVTVNTPVTGLTVSPATRAVCIGGSTTFTASTTGGSPVNYQWQRSTDAGLTWSNVTGATGATLTISNVTLNMTGYRYRVATTGNACAAVTSTTFGSITVNNLPAVTIAAPVVNIVPGTTSTISATSTPAAGATNSWSWTLNGNALAGNTSTQVASIDGLGTYQATVTDVNGCVNTSNQLVIGAEVSDKLWIYPNPSDGAFQVRLYHNVNSPEKRVVSVYNSAGQLITSQTLNLNYNSSPYQSLTFDLSGMARGVYVVKAAHEYSGRVTSGLLLIH